MWAGLCEKTSTASSTTTTLVQGRRGFQANRSLLASVLMCICLWSFDVYKYTLSSTMKDELHNAMSHVTEVYDAGIAVHYFLKLVDIHPGAILVV